MYRIELRRPAFKDLEAIPADYARLIAQHIDILEKNPRPNDSKKLRGDAGYSLRIGTYRVLYDIDDKVLCCKDNMN
jgi:mRNA interferase RelE/StbE